MDYIKPYHKCIMAGVLAHSNMGFGRPEVSRDIWFRDYTPSADALVDWFFQQRVEDDDSYKACREEVESWLTGDTVSAENVQKNWPDHWKWYLNQIKGKRWKHAKIAGEGASNQRLIARCLSEAIVECQDEKVDLKQDAAVQMLLNQLSHLLGQPHVMNLTDYSRYDSDIKDMLDAYDRWGASIKERGNATAHG